MSPAESQESAFRELFLDGYLSAKAWNNTPAQTDLLLEVLQRLEEIEQDVQTDLGSVLNESGSEGSTAQALLRYALRSYVERLLQTGGIEEMAQAEKIPLQPLQYTLVIPETQPLPTGENGNEWKRLQFEPRLAIILAHLGSIGVSKEDISLHKEQLDERHMRKEPYVLIQIPKLGKKILVCDQVGEVTFVLGYSTYRPTTKTAIEDSGGIRIVKLTEEQWIADVTAALQAPENELGIEPQIITADLRSPEYYTKQNVVLDLQAMAAAAGGKSIAEISTSKMCTRNIFTAANGETLSGRTYLNRAGVALGFSKTTRQSQSQTAAILAKLKDVAGVQVEKPPCEMDEKYFGNPTRVRKDLISWAIAAEKGQIGQLTTNDIKSNRFTTMNGESMMGATYLNRAGVALGLCETTREAKSQTAAILAKLKDVAGAQEEKPPCEMDEKYFGNPTRVREDLISWAIAAEKGQIGQLTTSDAKYKKFTAMNGESITGATYLSRAGVALGLCKTAREAESQNAAIATRLKTIAQGANVQIESAD